MDNLTELEKYSRIIFFSGVTGKRIASVDLTSSTLSINESTMVLDHVNSCKEPVVETGPYNGVWMIPELPPIEILGSYGDLEGSPPSQFLNLD